MNRCCNAIDWPTIAYKIIFTQSFIVMAVLYFLNGYGNKGMEIGPGDMHCWVSVLIVMYSEHCIIFLIPLFRLPAPECQRHKLINKCMLHTFTWASRLFPRDENPWLRTYRQLKNEYIYEPYLNSIKKSPCMLRSC